MAQLSTKPLALVFGATGRTGKSIVQGLLDSGDFRVAIIARSNARPEVSRFIDAGVTVHLIDVGRAGVEDLERALQGVDILISVAPAENLEIQRPLFAAAKVAGVKRVVPSAFATACPPGGMELQDRKLEILKYIKSLGLGWTWIDVGWWMQLSLPYPTGFVGHPIIPQFDKIFGSGDVPFATSDLDDIGRIVAQIVKDERTLNQSVFAYAEEVTQQDLWRVAQEFSPEGSEIVAQVSHDEVRQMAEAARSGFAKVPSLTFSEYLVSIHLRGDNTAAKAKELGHLDFRELYPQFKLTSLQEYAERFYRAPTDIPK